MYRNEKVCVTYLNTDYVITQSETTKMFHLWKGSKKIKESEEPYFDDIVYPKEGEPHKPRKHKTTK